MNIIKYNSDEFLNLGNSLNELLPRNPLIAFCGGRTILKILEPVKNHLTSSKNSTISSATFIMIDERLVALNDPDSNFKLIADEFFTPLSNELKNGSIKPFETTSIAESISNYSSEIEKHNGSIDLTILGVGEDGHIAGLFPEHRWPSDASFFTFSDSPKPPSDRMSATPGTIENSKTIILAFLGEGKREAWERFLENKESTNTLPCLLCRSAENLIVVTDLID